MFSYNNKKMKKSDQAKYFKNIKLYSIQAFL